MLTGLVDLAAMQQKHREWCDKNFPNETLSQATLGVCEEAGELAHSVLKMEQGIRGSKAKHLADASDAVGDICIYLMSVCDHLGIDLGDTIKETWAQVQARDWTKNREDGIVPPPVPSGECKAEYSPGPDKPSLFCFFVEGHVGPHSWAID